MLVEVGFPFYPVPVVLRTILVLSEISRLRRLVLLVPIFFYGWLIVVLLLLLVLLVLFLSSALVLLLRVKVVHVIVVCKPILKGRLLGC